MPRRVLAAFVVLVVFTAAASAVEWEEINWGTEVVLSSDTGLPAIVFHAAIEYSEFPDSYYLEGGWDVYEIVNGTQVTLRAAPSTARLRGETLTIYSATSQIQIEEGRTYGATLSLQDTVNDLSYQRTFSYGVEEALPMGISLRGWNGSEDIDLSDLPDEELEELVVLHNLLKRYRQSPIEKTASAFLRDDAAAQPNTAILRDGELGVGQEIDRCTYSACGVGCCSTCQEHEDEEEKSASSDDEPVADVRIDCIVYEGGYFEQDGNEYVQLKNYGDLEQDMLGWTLAKHGDSKNVFAFTESFVLEPGMTIRIYTSPLYAGEDGFSFGLEESLWTNVIQYPVALILIPMPEGSLAATGPISYSVVLTLYTYTLASRDDIASVRSELSKFAQEFQGSYYAGAGGSTLGAGKTIFVHEVAMQVLEAAAAEYRNR